MSGDYTVGDTLYFLFTSRQFTTGAPFTLAGAPVISAYEDASITEITAGVSIGVDHDSRTGLNLITVVASGANGFESGKDYHLVITTGTVDSVSVVGEVVGRFTLGRAAAFTRLGAPAGASVSADILVIDNFVDDLETRLGTPSNFGSGATIAANLVDIEAQTDDIGPAGAGLTAIPWNAAWDAEVQSEVNDGLVAYNAASTTNITAGTITTATSVTTVNGLAAGVITASSIAADAITDAKVAADVTIASVTGSVGSVTGAVGSVTGNVGGNVTGTVGSVVGAVGSVTAGVTVTTNNDKAGYVLSAAGVQAIWDALSSALTTVGSIGRRIVDFLTGDSFVRLGAPVGASISADIAGVQSDTDNMQTRIPAALVGGRMDVSVGAMAANTVTAAAIAAAALNGKGDWSTSAEIAALNDITVADIIAGVNEGSLDLQEMLRIILAACAGKSNSHETGLPKYRDFADTKNRISATTDVNGNRTAITLDGT